MKKIIATILIVTHSAVYSNPSDLDQYMRRANEFVHTEVTNILPGIINAMYKENLSDRKKNIQEVIVEYSNSKINLDKIIDEFDLLYKNTEIPKNINTSEYLNFNKKLDQLEKLKNQIRNSLYTFRKSEFNLRNISNSMNNYCENSNLIFNPKKMELQPQSLGKAVSKFDENDERTSLYYDITYKSEVQQSFLIGMGVAAISGFSISVAVFGLEKTLGFIGSFFTMGQAGGATFLSATGWGLLVLGALVAVGTIFAMFRKNDIEQKRKKELEELVKLHQQKFAEAKDWYLKNTWINQPEKVKQLAMSICKNTTKDFVVSGINISNREVVPNYILEIQSEINNTIININDFSNNKTYSLSQLSALIDRLNYLSGDIDLNELGNFDDSMTLSYIDAVNKIEKLNIDSEFNRKKFNLQKAKEESDLLINKFRSDRKVSEARRMFLQEVGYSLKNELFSNYKENIGNCKIYKENKDNLYFEVQSKIKYLREVFIDEFNKNDPFFISFIDRKVADLKFVYNKREQKICNKLEDL